MNLAEFDWIEKRGSSPLQDKFIHHLFVHGNGRIIACINEPTSPDGYVYSLSFMVPTSLPPMPLDFVGLDDAKRFAEGLVRHSNEDGSLVVKPPEVKDPPEDFQIPKSGKFE